MQKNRRKYKDPTKNEFESKENSNNTRKLQENGNTTKIVKALWDNVEAELFVLGTLNIGHYA